MNSLLTVRLGQYAILLALLGFALAMMVVPLRFVTAAKGNSGYPHPATETRLESKLKSRRPVLVSEWLSPNTGLNTFDLNFEPDSFSSAINITCPENITISTEDGKCSAIVNYSPPTATGTNPTVSCSPASGSRFNAGTTRVVCTATDASGQTAQCNFQITVKDTEAPKISCPSPVKGAAGTDCQLPVPNFLTGLTVSDNCSTGTSITLSQSPAAGMLVGLGTTEVTITATDAAGNQDTCKVNFAVEDQTPPTMTSMPDLIVNAAPGVCLAQVNYVTPTATDNCSRRVQVNCSQPPGSTFPVGINTVTCMATDEAGNTARTFFRITVRDLEPPSVTCRGPITMAANSPFGHIATFGEPAATDNCGTVVVSCQPQSGSTFPIGVTAVSCTAVDMSGNANRCAFPVTITGPTFNICVKSPASGDFFKTVTNVPKSNPNFGYWEYHKINSGVTEEILFGFANIVKTTTLGVTTIKDSVNKNYSMNGSFNLFFNLGKVNVTELSSGSTNSIEDKNYGNEPCP